MPKQSIARKEEKMSYKRVIIRMSITFLPADQHWLAALAQHLVHRAAYYDF